MDFSLDFGSIPALQDPFSALWFVALNGGFLIFLFVIFKRLLAMLEEAVAEQYLASQSRVLLAIRVPRSTEQTPMAVENFFSHLTGAYTGDAKSWEDRYFKGKVQEPISCEIIFEDGMVQFLVNTPVKFRDVVEASIYAQYPDVEVYEIPDYAEKYPQVWPNPDFDLWGCELVLTKPEAYPIKTYPAFEHSLQGSFKDPLASLLEYMGSMKPQDHVWIQFLLEPTKGDWIKKSAEEVKSILGTKKPPKKTRADKALEGMGSVGGHVAGMLFGKPPEPAKKEAEKDKAASMSPREKKVLELVQDKATKPGFKAKIRILYVAPRTVFNKGKIMTGVVGAFHQFGILDSNTFGVDSNSKVGPGKYTKEKGTWQKQNAMMKAYRHRLAREGAPLYVLNTEEIATLWHFPMIDIKAPLLSKSESKKAEPPSSLPMRELDEPVPLFSMKSSAESSQSDPNHEVPSNIPFV